MTKKLIVRKVESIERNLNCHWEFCKSLDAFTEIRQKNVKIRSKSVCKLTDFF